MDKDKLKKVAILARDGEPGEKKNAQVILDHHGVTVEELLSDEPIIVGVEIKFKTAFERTLTFQTYCKILNTDTISYYKSAQNLVRFEIPLSLAEHFRQSVETVLKLWRGELKRFQTAFVQRNRLFSTIPDKTPRESRVTMTQEEIAEMMMMAASIKKANIDHKMLTEGGDNNGE
jgi:hypothetical protein